MKAINRDEYQLSTGRRFYANNHIIGIDTDGGVSEGYDGSVSFVRYDYETNAYVDDWTPAEKRELADFMIRQWSVFKQGQLYDL